MIKYELSRRFDRLVNVWAFLPYAGNPHVQVWQVVAVVETWNAGMAYITASEKAGHPIREDFKAGE